MPQNKALKIARINQKCRLADLKTTFASYSYMCIEHKQKSGGEISHQSQAETKNVSKSESAENLRRPKKNNKGKEA